MAETSEASAAFRDRRIPVAELVSALRRADTSLELDLGPDGELVIAAVLLDGSLRHVRISAKGVRLQPEARSSALVPEGDLCAGCPHLVETEPSCLLLDRELMPDGANGPWKRCGYGYEEDEPCV